MIALLGLPCIALAANTEDDVKTTATDLDASATYTGGAPTQTSDVTFTNSTYASTMFTINSTDE